MYYFEFRDPACFPMKVLCYLITTAELLELEQHHAYTLTYSSNSESDTESAGFESAVLDLQNTEHAVFLSALC